MMPSLGTHPPTAKDTVTVDVTPAMSLADAHVNAPPIAPTVVASVVTDTGPSISTSLPSSVFSSATDTLTNDDGVPTPATCSDTELNSSIEPVNATFSTPVSRLQLVVDTATLVAPTVQLTLGALVSSHQGSAFSSSVTTAFSSVHERWCDDDSVCGKLSTIVLPAFSSPLVSKTNPRLLTSPGLSTDMSQL